MTLLTPSNRGRPTHPQKLIIVKATWLSFLFLLSSELEQLREEMEQLLALAAESCERLLSKDVPSPTEVSSNQDVGLRDLLVTLLEECGIEAKLQLQVQVERELIVR